MNENDETKEQAVKTEEHIPVDDGESLDVVSFNDPVGALTFYSDQAMQQSLEVIKRRNTYIKEVTAMAFRELEADDFKKFGDRYYLEGKGAMKVMKFLGISVENIRRIPTTSYEPVKYDPANRGRVTFMADFRLGDLKSVGIGIRDTHNNFFCKKGDAYMPFEDIELTNLDRAAKTQMYADGITSLMGWKGITAKYLEDNGFDPEKIAEIEFQTKSKGGGGKSKKEPDDPKTEELKKSIGGMLLKMCDGDKDGAADKLESLTEWTNDKGEKVKGKRSLSDMSAKQTNFVHEKVKKEFDEYLKS